MPSNDFADAKKRVLEFFQNEIQKYVVRDIQVLNDIRPKGSEGTGACTVPHALMLFSVIDYLGYLTRNDLNPSKSDTNGNFKYLLSESSYFPSEYSTHWEKILKLFRHGLVHQFFPKACGISKSGLTQPLIFNIAGLLNLNVDVLSRDTVAAINQISKDVSETLTSDLAFRINQRLNQLCREDYSELARH